MGKKILLTAVVECKTPSAELPNNVVPEGSTVLSIRTREGGNGRKSKNKKNLANSAAFISAHLTLKDKNQNSILDHLPLEIVKHLTFNNEGKGIEVNRSDIDWNTSNITFNDEAAVVAGEVIELIFEIEK